MLEAGPTFLHGVLDFYKLHTYHLLLELLCNLKQEITGAGARDAYIYEFHPKQNLATFEFSRAIIYVTIKRTIT